MTYPKRLIEVDLPIKRISAHARREKSIRHGHISTLHIWWARRPLAACRAVICAALWPDPADPICPQSFRDAAARLISEFAKKVYATAALHATASRESFGQWEGIVASRPLSIVPGPLSVATRERNEPTPGTPHLTPEAAARDQARQSGIAFDTHDAAHLTRLRGALLDFIADFANWDNSTVPAYLETARSLTAAAHQALGGEPGTRPLVVDPFAGGGSIPLEALRVGADAFASDLNPVAVLLNKVVLEYIPKYGQRLADEVRNWGEWIKKEAEKELAEFYPKDADGATPIAYLWARTIQCEGPGCGAEVPLVKSLWLAKQAKRSIALQLVQNPKAKRVDFRIIVKQRDGWLDQTNLKIEVKHPNFDGAVKRGSATCPCCGYTTPVARVREQLKARRGGANDARLFCVVKTKPGEDRRSYRLPSKLDEHTFAAAIEELARRVKAHKGDLSLFPDEVIPMTEIRRISVPIYGMTSWGDLFSARQALALSTLVGLLSRVRHKLSAQDAELARTVTSVLSLAISRFSDICNALCMWEATKTQVRHMFTRQAIGMLWDYAEPHIFAEAAGNFSVTLGTMMEVLERESTISLPMGHVGQTSATQHPLPEHSADALITDPPYYDAVPYAHLSDFFYVWLRRALAHEHPDLFREPEVPKVSEIVVDRPHELSQSQKGIAFYERELSKAFAEARRILRPDGVGTIVFASKTTASWEAILKAVVDAGWIITGSWPIDTEMETRVAAQGQARLASSVHLVCRPRENPDGSVRTDEIGDWRDVLQELPSRIHEWMPRLSQEGVVGADAIFSCLGPALEIFSRYSRVEKSNGDAVPLREYLEHVWAAVSKEALSMIFKDADAAGLEPDARLTAMWLWTLRTDRSASDGNASAEDEGEDDTGDDTDAEDEDATARSPKGAGYALEFDAARKIAQGLGANLDTLKSVVEVKGRTARLRTVSEREAFLFARQSSAMLAGQSSGSVEAAPAPGRGKSKRPARGQQSFGVTDEDRLTAEPALSREARADISPASETPSDWTTAETVLDRVHQAMLLFAKGRSDALKRFLVDDGIGRELRFWKLAQSLSALYPPGADEKRWVDGVLARKKGLGF